MARNKSVIEISVIGHKDLIEAQKAVTKYSDALKKAKADVVVPIPLKVVLAVFKSLTSVQLLPLYDSLFAT